MLDLILEKMTIEGQYNKLLDKVQSWTRQTGKHLSVGVEIDGQQQLNISALKNKQLEKNVWFDFARQIGGSPNSQGISRRRAGGDKHSQFMRIHNMFLNGKIYFPIELKEDPSMKELMNELKYITYQAITSKHDDGLDLVSMLGIMEMTYPNAEATGLDRKLQSENSIFGSYFDTSSSSESKKSTVF